MTAKKCRRWFSTRYLTADPRALALGRLLLGGTLLLDLWRRGRSFETWYTSGGLLPQQAVFTQSNSGPSFSLFFAAHTSTQAALGFVSCALAYIALFIGYRTRAAQLASLLGVLSLHARAEFVQSGGDVVLGELALWSCFLPLGTRYSVDAVRAARRSSAASSDGLAPVKSGAVLALLLQVASIYAFNALHKTGDTWREGTVVHYLLYQSSNNTWLAVWLRGCLTLNGSRFLTWTALAVESILPILILSPFTQPAARRSAAVLIVGLHTGFALCLNLGIFGPAMLAFTPYLLDGALCDRMEARLAASKPALPLRHAAEHVAAWVARCRRPRNIAAAAPEATWFSRFGAGCLLVLSVAAGSEALVANSLVTGISWQPRWLHMVVSYVQASQGWFMYAPEAPTADSNIRVDAVTVDGRHVDPFNELASPGNRRPGARIPPHLGRDVLFSAYVMRLPWSPAYFPAFRRWLLRYPERTQRSVDRIVSFQAFVDQQDSPLPGHTDPTRARERCFLRYPPAPTVAADVSTNSHSLALRKP